MPAHGSPDEIKTDTRTARSGHLVLIVGPSGSGKDTLINGARAAFAENKAFHFVRRVVTRPPSQWEAHDSLDVETFLERKQIGAYALHWEAHGLHYGVPSSILASLEAGRIVVCNCSRSIIAEARARFSQLGVSQVNVVLVTAPADILAARLTGRGRENSFATRIDRSEEPGAKAQVDHIIVNDGEPDAAVARLVNILAELKSP